jgi:CheY-like chemotaxis protein
MTSPWLLIVEDDADVRDAMAAALRDHGHEVVALADAAEALQLLSEARLPSAVILDLGLPGMSGLELLERVDEIPDASKIRIVVVTGLDVTAEELAFASVHAVLNKPVPVERLLAVLGEIVEGVEAPTPSAGTRVRRNHRLR